MTTALEYGLAYNQFIISETINQQYMLNCINEAISLSEGVSPDFESLNEAFTDAIKSAWNKFVTFIKKIFAKFRATFSRFVDSDKTYLENYHDIIKTQPIKISANLTNYNLSLIAATHAEYFDTNKVQAYLGGLQTTLQGSNLPPNIKNFKGEEVDDFKVWVDDQFCSGDKEATVSADSLNMTDVYNFLHEYKDKNVNGDLAKDEKAILDSASAFQKIIDKIQDEKPAPVEQKEEKPGESKEKETDKTSETQEVRDSEVKGSETPGGTLNQTDGEQGQSNANMTGHDDSVILQLDKSFIGLSEKVSMTKPTNDSGNKTAGVDNKHTKIQDSENFGKNAKGVSGEKSDTTTMTNATSSYTKEQCTKMLTSYKGIYATICSSKLHWVHEAYKDYMAIVRAHVSSYVGETVNTSATAQAASNYSFSVEGVKTLITNAKAEIQTVFQNPDQSQKQPLMKRIIDRIKYNFENEVQRRTIDKIVDKLCAIGPDAVLQALNNMTQQGDPLTAENLEKETQTT